MIKKVIFVLVSLAILGGGFIALDKLSYWERSVRVFKMDEQSFGRRGFGERGESREARFGAEGRGRSGDGNSSGFRGDNGHGRGNFRGGKKVNLARIPWFLAVFASFTVITFCLDRLYLLLRKRR